MEKTVLANEASKRITDSHGIWVRGYSCYTLVKNLAALCQCFENLRRLDIGVKD